jgi:PKD repeat protein
MKKSLHFLTHGNSKQVLILVILTVYFSISGIAGDVKYNDSWGKAGYTLVSQNSSKVVLNYSITEFSLSDFQVNGESMQNLALPGHFLPNNEGAPNLPGSGRYLAIPSGAEASINIVSYRSETLNNVNLAPAFRIPWETEPGDLEYVKDESIYTANKFYPDEPIHLSKNDLVRGVEVVMLGITPFHYNPVTRQLIVYRDLEIEVTFTGGNGHFGDDRLRSRWWDPMLSDMLLNYQSLPEMDYNKSYQAVDDIGCEYLIITPNGAEFQQWADSIRKFRTLQGILTDVKTIADIGGNNVTTIENYINNAYNNWDIVPAACLLLGDYGTTGNTITSPIWDSYCVSDNIYADVNNNDMPDIVFARMTAQNAAQLQVMVTKFLDYERTPPTSEYFYEHPVTALGWQTERWFQICTEVIGGFWREVQGKNPTRVNAIYSGTPGAVWSTATNTATVVNYFGPSGLGYIPAQPSSLGGWSGGTAAMVNAAINSGAFMLQHRDHGYEQGWGEPDYSSTSISGLTNTDLTFVWSVNCLTGKYNYSSEVFSEKFHRYTYNGQNSGCVGINAASEVSYSFVNDAYVWGAYDNMWPDFMPDYGSTPEPRGVLPAFACAAGKYFLQQSSWPYNVDNKEVTYNLFHHHGDAFSTIYSEVPQNLAVTHNPILYAGVTTFEVSANEDALIALTVNGEIIGTATATGAPVTINIPGQVPPDQMLVTITKQNYYRYESLVDVIPPTGPYIVKETYTINDNAGGNGNGLMDYGETNLLSLTVKNVGVQQANNVVVTLSTADTYITITDNTASYGSIAAGATAVVADGFAYTVANDIPDLHNASFEVSATNGTDTWISYIAIEGHAPTLDFVDFTIADPTGNNNGKIDPGETVNITIEVNNSGSSEAFNVLGELTEMDQYLTVNTSQINIGNLAGGASGSGVFSVTAAANTPAGHLANFEFNMTGDLGISGYGEFEVVIGQIPVLIVDLDGNGNSAPQMEAALNTMDVAYEKLTSFPTDLNLYSTIFVCLGIYSDNHVLSSSEGQNLANYLNNGGSLYMEGGDTWAYDNETAVHPMFKINGTTDGTSDMNTVNGIAGTFTAGMSFSYSGDNNYMDHLEQISPAFKILNNQSPLYGTAVAYDAGNYKTIGTSHEFGGLTDGTAPSTKEQLMTEYLDFLGISVSLQATFNSDITQVCEDGTVNFYDQSSGNVILWNWIFEGGNPATSTVQNPTVVYENSGTYDVSLTVSDGVESNTIELIDYISVTSIPGIAPAPTGLTLVCAGWANTAYSTAGIAGITTYDWILEPANAGTVNGTGVNVTVQWTTGFLGVATLKVAGENVCGTGTYSNPLTITIYLPEVTLAPFEWICLGWPAIELSGGEPEGGVYSGPGVTNGWFDPAVAGVGTHTITYTYEDPNGCENSATETILVDPCTGMDENQNFGEVLIFPNPNNGTFTLKLNLISDEMVDLRIYNSLNELVFEEAGISTVKNFSRVINLNDFSGGIYYLHISGDSTAQVKKIIIQK